MELQICKPGKSKLVMEDHEKVKMFCQFNSLTIHQFLDISAFLPKSSIF